MTPPPNRAHNPDAARLYRQGMALLKHGDAARAASVLGQAASMALDAQSAASVRRGLGIALTRCGRWAEAIAPLREAEHVLRNDPGIPQTLAQALRELGRYEEAIQACRRCLKLAPGFAPVARLEIELLVRQHRDDEASERIREAERAGVTDPNIDVAYAILALRSGAHDGAIDRLRRRLDAGVETKREHAVLHYVLAEVLDAAGRYDEAWSACTEANESTGQVFDTAAFHEAVDAAVRTWTPEQIERMREGASSDERPVLIVGMPRSGTTLTERMLAPHPGVHAGGEMMVLSECASMIARATGALVDRTPGVILPEHIAAAARHYSGTLDRVGAGAARVTNKLPMNVGILGLFAAMYPRGWIVHCRRDPRDVCLSCYFRDFSTPTPYALRPEWLAEHYRGYARLVEHWRDTFAAMPDPPNVHEVEYESLVADPESGARALVAGVGLEWHAACAAPASNERINLTQRPDQAGKGVYGSSVRRHERYGAHIGAWRDLVAPSFSDG